MSIYSVGGVGSGQQLFEAYAEGKVTTSHRSSGVTSQKSGSGFTTTKEDFFTKLAELARCEPDKFTRLTQKISNELTSTASQASGTTKTFLQHLADSFETASQTGSATSLDPSANLAPAHMSSHIGHHPEFTNLKHYNPAGTSSDLLSPLASSSAMYGQGPVPTDVGTVFQNLYMTVMLD